MMLFRAPTPLLWETSAKPNFPVFPNLSSIAPAARAISAKIRA
jgi:hypothetical protein